MTLPISDDIDSRIRRLEEMQQQRQPAAELDPETLDQIWDNYQRAVLDRDPATTDKCRKDTKTIRVHRPLLCDERFMYEGRSVSMGETPGRLIVPEILDAWVRHMQARPRRDGRKGPLKASYRNRMAGTLYTVLTWKFGRHNPLHGWKKEDATGGVRQGVFRDEAQLSEYCRYLPGIVADVLRLSCEPGCMRRQELVMLELTDINWTTRMIVMPAWKCKNGEERKFPVSDASFAMLERRRASARPGNPYVFQVERPSNKREGRDCAPGTVMGTWICQALSGRPPHRAGHLCFTTLTRAMRRATEISGVRLGDNQERAVLHSGRHTGATWLAAKTRGNLDVIQELGGWKTTKIARGYIKRSEDTYEEVRDLANQPMSAVIQSRREAVQSVRKAPQAAPAQRRSVRSGGGR